MAYRNVTDFLADAKSNGLSREEAAKALTVYREENGTFADESPSPAPMSSQVHEQVGGERPGFGSRLLNTVGKGLDILDQYTGAPVRQGIATAQRELADNGPMPSMKDFSAIGKGIKAGAEQFGRPTSEAATGRDIAENMGATGVGADILGVGMGIATDPTNFIPGKALTAPLRAAAKAPILAKVMKGGSAVAETVKGTASNVIKGGLARASNMSREALETAASDRQLFNQAKGMATDIAGAERGAAEDVLIAAERVRTGAQQGVEQAVGQYNPDLAYRSGAKIRGALDDASVAVGERFGKTTDDILTANDAASRGLQYRGRMNTAAYELNRIAKEAGAASDDGALIASKFGGKPVLDGEASILKRVATESIGVDDVQGLIDLKKGVFARIQQLKKTPDGAALFSKESGGTKALDEMYSTIKDEVGHHIELRIKETVKGGRAGALADLTRMRWDDAHQIYAKTRKALDSVGDAVGVNVGRDLEDLAKGLSNLSIDDLYQLKTMAKSDQIMAPVFKQIGDSFIDGMVVNASKSGRVDVGELRKAWNSLGASKGVLYDKSRISQIEGAINRFEEITKQTNLLGTSPQGAGSALRQATGESVKAKYIQDQLAGLDALLGLKSEESLVKKAQALKIAGGIQSGVTMSRTGLGLAGGAAGYHQGEQEGGVVGGVLGALTGAYLTSPAAAIAAFRVLNQGAKVASSASTTGLKLARNVGRIGMKALEAPSPIRAGVLELGRLSNEGQR